MIFFQLNPNHSWSLDTKSPGLFFKEVPAPILGPSSSEYKISHQYTVSPYSEKNLISHKCLIGPHFEEKKSLIPGLFPTPLKNCKTHYRLKWRRAGLFLKTYKICGFVSNMIYHSVWWIINSGNQFLYMLKVSWRSDFNLPRYSLSHERIILSHFTIFCPLTYLLREGLQ